MKTISIIVCLSFLVASLSLQAQSNIQQSVSVNADGSAPNASAQLDVSATDKGMLVPRMTTAQRVAIASPATGLLVFDVTTGGFWFYNGTAWANLSVPAKLADADNDTKIQVEESPDEDFIRFDLAGTENMVLRKNAGGHARLELPTASANTFIGVGAGSVNTTGSDNTATGISALSANTTGSFNTATGAEALVTNTTGFSNTANGARALRFNTTGADNTASGTSALASNTTGSFNTAAGTSALALNTTGSFNTASGTSSLAANVVGADNTAIGFEALELNTTGGDNTALGNEAGDNNTTGNGNTAIGSFADFASGNLTNATAIGYTALANCSNCIVLGGTGPATTDVGIGTATPTSRLHINGVGYGMSHTHNDIGMSTFVDADAMLKAGWFGTYSNHPLLFYTNDNTVPNMALMQAGNTGIGTVAPNASALLDLSATNRGMLVPRMTSAQRVAIASPATGLLVYDTDANAFWFYNGSAWAKISPQTVLADADNDTKIQVEESANENVIRFDLGGTESLVLQKNAGGSPRLELTSTFSNTFVGKDAGTANTSGDFNSAFGQNTLFSNTTGGENTALGKHAGYANTTGSGNTAIGSFANFATGNLTKATAIGYNASVNCSNCMVLGGTGADAVKVGVGRNPATNVLEVEGDASKSSAGDWLANSDARLKKNIHPLNSEQMLQKMLALQGVSYEWNDDKTGSVRPEGAQFGFTAQNIQSVFPSLVQEDKLGYLQTAYGTYDAMTVEAIRALNDHLISLENKIAALEQQSKQLGAENAALQNLSRELGAKLQNLENWQVEQGQKIKNQFGRLP